MIFFGARQAFANREEAVAWLEGDEAAEVFAIVRTLDLHGASADAMPEQ